MLNKIPEARNSKHNTGNNEYSTANNSREHVTINFDYKRQNCTSIRKRGTLIARKIDCCSSLLQAKYTDKPLLFAAKSYILNRR